jgi:hypothetical protein
MILMYSTEVLPEVRKTMKYFRTKILSYFQKVPSKVLSYFRTKYICTVRNYVLILPYYVYGSTFVLSYLRTFEGINLPEIDIYSVQHITFVRCSGQKWTINRKNEISLVITFFYSCKFHDQSIFIQYTKSWKVFSAWLIYDVDQCDES